MLVEPDPAGNLLVLPVTHNPVPHVEILPIQGDQLPQVEIFPVQHDLRPNVVTRQAPAAAAAQGGRSPYLEALRLVVGFEVSYKLAEFRSLARSLDFS